MYQWILGWLMLTAGVVLGAAETKLPANWHSDAARYRLEVERTRPEEAQYVDLRHLLLPVTLENGVTVTDAAGQALPFLLQDDYTLLLPGGSKGGVNHIYFGYDAKQSFDRWDEKLGKRPDGSRLRIKVVNAHSVATSDEEWRTQRLENLSRRYTRQIENNEKYYGRMFTESITGPVFWTRYPSEIWQVTSQVRQMNTFLMRLQQRKTRAIRPRWRFWPGYGLPVWCFPLQSRNYFYRLQWPMRQFLNIPKNWRRDIDKTEQETPGAAERELVGVFDRPNVRVQGDAAVRDINLPKRPFDSFGNFSIRYQGKILIEEEGDYEFGANSNSLVILRADGKNLLLQSGKRKPTEVKMNVVRVHFKPGVHDFELYYHKSRVTSEISCFWRKAGDSEFTLLNDENFHPAIPVKLLGCIRHDGGRYPLVRRNDRHQLHSGKREFWSLAGFTPVEPAGLEFDWISHGEKLPGNSLPYLALPPKDQPALMLKPRTAGYLELPVLHYPVPYEPVSVDSGLNLKLWAPLFIYDDEPLDFFREINSRLPLATQVRLRQRPNRPQTVFPTREEYLPLAAKPVELVDRFAPDVMHKERVVLDGRELVKGLRVEWELAIPEVVFDRRTVFFAPLEALPDDLKAGPGGLYDGTGALVVPVLRRPTLHQLREWELPKTLQYILQPKHRILVIGEDFGSGEKRFSRVLKKLAEERELNLEFHAWAEDGRHSGSRMLDSLPVLLPKLNMADAELVVVIPPPRGRLRSLADWENHRALALVLEKLRRGSALRELKLATPLPSADAADEAADASWVESLRILRREYGCSMLEYGNAFAAQPEFRNFYRASQGDWAASLPEQGAQKAAELLLKMLK